MFKLLEIKQQQRVCVSRVSLHGVVQHVPVVLFMNDPGNITFLHARVTRRMRLGVIHCGNSSRLPLLLSFAFTVCEIFQDSGRKSVLYPAEAPLENERLFPNPVGSLEFYFVVNV